MPSISDYKKHYPSLTSAQVKLMHAARIAAQYGAWSLSHIRTVALEPLICQVEPNAEQHAIADALLNDPKATNYERDILNYPRMNNQERLLSLTQAPQVPFDGIELQEPDWAVCKHVGYHSDTTDTDQNAYAFWCIKSTGPMTLMLGGNAYPMPDGQLVIFDARVPHALVSSSPDATMVGIISTAPLTPELREHLGIAWRRAGAVSLDTLALMNRLVVDETSGAFSAPGM